MTDATPTICYCRRESHEAGSIEKCSQAESWANLKSQRDRLQAEHKKVGEFGEVFEDGIGNVASANQQDRERALDALWDAWHAVKEARGES